MKLSVSVEQGIGVAVARNNAAVWSGAWAAESGDPAEVPGEPHKHVLRATPRWCEGPFSCAFPIHPSAGRQ